MRSELDCIEESVKREVAMLTHKDGLEVSQVSDVMGYEDSSMVYAISNPTKASMPSVSRFILACRRLSTLGNTRLVRLLLDPSHTIRKVGTYLVNHSLDDEQRDLFRSFIAMQDAVDAKDYTTAESEIDRMHSVLDRARAEVALSRGQ